MSMNHVQRSRFRKTNKWHQFKAKCRLHTSRDFITKEPLLRNWNLHHLDLNVQRYDDLSDMKRFMPLNPKTHEVIHELFKWYRKDHKVLERIKYTLDKMEVYTDELFADNGVSEDDSTEHRTACKVVHTQQNRKHIHAVKR